MFPDSKPRILLVDDDSSIHMDYRKILGPAPLTAAGSRPASRARTVVNPVTFELESAFQGRDGLEKLLDSINTQRPFSLAFVDMNMPPGWDGIETIEHLWRADPALQIVVCTAADLSWDELRSRLGPSDNLLILKKPFDPIEVRQLAYTMTRKWFVTRQAEHHLELLDKMVSDRTRSLEETNAELRRSEERFAKAFLSSPIPLAIQAVNDDRFVDVNDAFALLTGFERVELVGRTPLEVRICIDYETSVVKELNAGKLVRNAEAQVSTRDGEIRNVVVSLERITLSDEPHLLVMLQEAPHTEANGSAIFEIDLNSIAALDLGPSASSTAPAADFTELSEEPEAESRTYTVLIVEDDPAVRSITKDVLLSNDYNVIEAANADAALQLWPERRHEIDLLFTDMVMPGSANGLELAEMLLGDKPDLKVIYTSAYSKELFTSDLELREGRNYLQKPYLSSALTEILRQSLQPVVLV
jgi:PAS domain S-box-containing protein